MTLHGQTKVRDAHRGLRLPVKSFFQMTDTREVEFIGRDTRFSFIPMNAIIDELIVTGGSWSARIHCCPNRCSIYSDNGVRTDLLNYMRPIPTSNNRIHGTEMDFHSSSDFSLGKTLIKKSSYFSDFFGSKFAIVQKVYVKGKWPIAK